MIAVLGVARTTRAESDVKLLHLPRLHILVFNRDWQFGIL